MVISRFCRLVKSTVAGAQQLTFRQGKTCCYKPHNYVGRNSKIISLNLKNINPLLKIMGPTNHYSSFPFQFLHYIFYNWKTYYYEKQNFYTASFPASIYKVVELIQLMTEY